MKQFLTNFTPIIAECNQGQKKLGVEMGSRVLFNLLANTSDFKNSQQLPNNLFDSPKGYKLLYNLCTNTKYPLVLGGDHSIGTSTVLASVKKHYPNLSVVWIDAHADINTMESSLTKNKHGMPLAYAAGLDKCWFDTELDVKLPMDQLLYTGIRDLDDYEINVIDKYKIKNYSPNQIIDYINKTKDFIHISFDVDGLDQTELDSTGTVSPQSKGKGLTTDEVKNIIDFTLGKNKLVGLDIVEFNPKLGNLTKSTEAIKKIFC
jgi:arginase